MFMTLALHIIKIAINQQLIQNQDQPLVIAPPVALKTEDNGTADQLKKINTVENELPMKIMLSRPCL